MAVDHADDSDSGEEPPKRRKRPSSSTKPAPRRSTKSVPNGVKKSSLKPQSRGKEKAKLMEMSDDTREVR
jgi:hypothetical protein